LQIGKSKIEVNSVEKLLVYTNRKEFLEKRRGLVKKGYFIADMHTHTLKSDGSSSLKMMIRKAKKIGIYLAITDHNDVPNYSSVDTGKVIPGIEVKTAEKIDVLVYFNSIQELERFHKKYVEPRRSFGYTTDIALNELLRILRRIDCVVTMAHPMHPGSANILSKVKKLQKKELSAINCIEIFNSLHESVVQKEAIKVAKELGKVQTTGTDSHMIFTLGNAVHYCKAKNKREFIEKFKKGKTNMIAISTPRAIDMMGDWATTWLHIRRAFMVLKNKFKV